MKEFFVKYGYFIFWGTFLLIIGSYSYFAVRYEQRRKIELKQKVWELEPELKSPAPRRADLKWQWQFFYVIMGATTIYFLYITIEKRTLFAFLLFSTAAGILMEFVRKLSFEKKIIKFGHATSAKILTRLDYQSHKPDEITFQYEFNSKAYYKKRKVLDLYKNYYPEVKVTVIVDPSDPETYVLYGASFFVAFSR